MRWFVQFCDCNNLWTEGIGKKRIPFWNNSVFKIKACMVIQGRWFLLEILLDFLTLLHLGSYNYNDDNSSLRHTAGKLEVLVSRCYFGSIKFLLKSCNWPLYSCNFKSGTVDLALVSAVHRPEINAKSRGFEDQRLVKTASVWTSGDWYTSVFTFPALFSLRWSEITFLLLFFLIKHALLLILHAFLHLGMQTIRTRLCIPMPSFCSDTKNLNNSQLLATDPETKRKTLPWYWFHPFQHHIDALVWTDWKL